MPSNHYLVISDIHLCDVEDHADGWKRHKSSTWVSDDEMDRMVASFEERVAADETFTLVLNGDIFDFDLVTAIPPEAPWAIGPLEHRYGLDATEPKSTWKLGRILDHHPVFVAMLARLLARGHRVVLTIGNHDRELWFPAVAALLHARVAATMPHDAPPYEPVVIAPWFFHVPGEVYVEHGHQYDYYSSFRYNLEPVYERGGEQHIALSPGNLSNRFLLSNIGFFNPHATDYILSAYGYIRHWLQHYAFSRRALILTWLVGSIRALFALLATRARLEQHPPRDYARHIHAAAARNGVSTETAEALYALKKLPITNRIYKLVREFWIDRVLIAASMIGGTIAIGVSGAALWVKLVVPLIVFPLAWFLYQWAAGNDNALTTEHHATKVAHAIATLVPVRAVVFGHTHVAGLVPLARDIVFANSGTWAPIWDRHHPTQPARGLRNYVHIACERLGATPNACQVTVGSWQPLAP